MLLVQLEQVHISMQHWPSYKADCMGQVRTTSGLGRYSFNPSTHYVKL